MPPVPDPSSTSALESGLAALKRGDYATAIARLEAIPLPSDHPLSAKAQMGLAAAYAHNGDPIRAASLCKSLYRSNQPQVRDWAEQTLSGLLKRYPQIASQLQNLQTEDVAGQSAALPDVAAEPDVAADLTGFVPLSRSPAPAIDPSGFVPLTADSFDQPVNSGATPTQADQRSIPLGESSQPSNMGDIEAQPGSVQTEAAELSTPLTLASVDTAIQSDEWKDSTVAQPGVAKSQSATTSTSPQPFDQPSIYQPVWRQAERARPWKPSGNINIIPLLLLQVGTVVALFWMVQTIVYSVIVNYSIALTMIPFLELRRYLYEPPVGPILMLLGILFVSSRWVLDGLLTAFHGLQPLSLGKLAAYSPETVQALQRFCRQQKVSMPALGILPTSAPIAFSYGCLPQVTRTVVSQGLLDQLAADEVATIYAREVGHISTWTVPLLSLVVLMTQFPYTLYWVAAEWGNRQQAPVVRAVATIVAAVSYGLYALLRWMGLWLSRHRLYYSDRIAVDLTGNPNGLVRALLKIAIGITKNVQSQGKTSYLLEGFDLLAPLEHRAATTLGSVYPYTPLEPVLEWDRSNPLLPWLAINNSHSPLGDRLNLLTLYARQWRLSTELNFNANQQSAKRQQKSGLTLSQWKTLLLQGAPFFGLVLGLAAGYLLSSIGWFGQRYSITAISWMYRDYALMRGLPLIGFSLGTFLRINSFFPDLKLSNSSSTKSSSLVNLLTDPTTTPLDSVPVQLEGKLLGRTGISNLLSQDLLLQTSTGIVRLHCLSKFGPIGNLLPQTVRPSDLINQNLIVTGWFRRGVIPWVDVEVLRTAGGRISRSNHPVWSTLLGLLIAAWGIYTIFRVGLL